jgi:membrane protease YdiL (CAAX protease family)
VQTCSYCGRENSDEASHCLECGTELVRLAAVPVAVADTVVPVLAAVDESPPQLISATERQLRIAEVWIVCAVAFGGSVYGSLVAFGSTYRATRSGVYTNYSSVYMMLHEATALALLWWVLARRGKSLISWVLPLRSKDSGDSVVLWIGGCVAFYGCYSALHAMGLTPNDRATQFRSVTHHLFGAKVAIGAFLFQFLNPFFEELIVRGYLMTEIAALTGSIRKAVLVSVLLQTTYHLYQGGASALSLGVLFLISSIYYARTGRIQAVVLAHLYVDVSATLFTMFYSR